MSKKKIKVIVIRSEFNEDIVENLYSGVKKCFEDEKILFEIKDIKVPGAFELPYMAKQALALQPDCIITLGCVIKGETGSITTISHLSLSLSLHALHPWIILKRRVRMRRSGVPMFLLMLDPGGNLNGRETDRRTDPFFVLKKK